MRRSKIARDGRLTTMALWLVVVATLAAAPASAQSVSPFRELGAAVQEGDSVVVRAQAGNTVRGTVCAVSSSVLSVRIDGVAREWPATDVAEVRRLGNSWRNGALWGLAIGGGTAAALGGYTFALCANEGGANCPQLKRQSVLIPLVAGVGIGLLVDALRSGETVVYKQPAVTVVPMVAPGSYSRPRPGGSEPARHSGHEVSDGRAPVSLDTRARAHFLGSIQ